jgi:type I restriction enzyme S subunit
MSKTSLLSDDIVLISGQHVVADAIATDGTGVPYLTGPTDFTNGKPAHKRFAIRAGAFCEKGDVLVVVKGSGTGAAFKSDNRYAIGRQLMAVRAGSWHPDFVYHVVAFNSNRYQTQATGLIPGISREHILNTRFHSIHFPQQRKIADILTTWDEALEKLDALIAAKDRCKQALMQQLLTGRKRVKDAAGTWKKVRMSEVLERVFRPINWHPDLDLNLISLRRRCGGLFRRPDVKGSEYKTQDLHEIRSGDFLISKRQVVHGAWGLVSPGFEGGHVSKEYAILDNRAPDKLHMPFFAWLAQTRRLIRLARVSSTGVHIEKLIFDPDVFLRESIRLPADLTEQEKIATILDTADQELILLRRQREALDQQKRGLMQRLLTGKIRVSIS